MVFFDEKICMPSPPGRSSVNHKTFFFVCISISFYIMKWPHSLLYFVVFVVCVYKLRFVNFHQAILIIVKSNKKKVWWEVWELWISHCCCIVGERVSLTNVAENELLLHQIYRPVVYSVWTHSHWLTWTTPSCSIQCLDTLTLAYLDHTVL